MQERGLAQSCFNLFEGRNRTFNATRRASRMIGCASWPLRILQWWNTGLTSTPEQRQLAAPVLGIVARMVLSSTELYRKF